MTRDSDFIGRWSDRKRAVAEEARVPEAAEDPPEDIPEEDMSDEELLAKFELPEPESLKQGDDFSAFMAKAVPDRLRNRALKVLWRSNPTLANIDGLVDYGEDFTDAAMVPEVLNTAYKVGRGFLKDILEEEEATEGEDALADDADGKSDGDIAPETSEPPRVAQAPEPEPDLPPVAVDTTPHTPRPRMKFETG